MITWGLFYFSNMNLSELLKKKNTIQNTKGGRYYSTTYDANLDLFAGISRENSDTELIKKFDAALNETKDLALANLLYLLDVRGGKGERRIFKVLFKYLCERYPEDATIVLKVIPELGRWDYVLEAIDTPVEKQAVKMIQSQLISDLSSDGNISLLAKWLPSLRTHNKTNKFAKNICKKLNLTEKEYRALLKLLRHKIGLVEHKLTDKQYDTIDFEKVPTKAMLKYKKTFSEKCKDYSSYLNDVESGEKKINTNGLFCYEIVRKKLNSGYLNPVNEKLLDLMWKNQKDFLKGNKNNVLVMADTSGSMTWDNNLPMSNSLGLAIYIAERNHGMFHNMFMTFSEQPRLQVLNGNTLSEKLNEIESIVSNTDIDAAFELLLNTAVENDLSQQDMPSHLIIISDMEWDMGVYCGNDPYTTSTNPFGFTYRNRPKPTTNFEGWKKAFSDAGYKLPQIIFWNVASRTQGLPATKFDGDVAMISGFNTSVLENILDPERLTPVGIMIDTLDKYLKIIKDSN